MQDDQLVSHPGIPAALPTVQPRSLVDQITAVALRVSPLRLGLVQVLFAFVLSTLMLSLPARQPGFMGVVNNANGPRAYHRLFIWRNELGTLGERLSGLGISTDYFIWFVRGSHVLLALTAGAALIARRHRAHRTVAAAGA